MPLSKRENKDYQKFENWAKKTLKDSDTIDIYALYDSKISISENKTFFLKTYPIKDELMAKKVNGDKLRRIKEKEAEIKEETNKLMSEWKQNKTAGAKLSFLEPVKEYIRMTIRGHSYGTIIIGEGGISKSFSAFEVLREEKVTDYAYLSTYSTPLALYTFLLENKDKTIILDDVYGLGKPEIISILKSALWEVNGKRILNWNSKDKRMENIQPMYEFTGRLIILANKLNLNDANIQALITRTNFYELKISHREKLSIMAELSNLPYKNLNAEERQQVFNELSKLLTPATSFNFRTLIQAYNFYLYDKVNWQNLLKNILQEDEEIKLALEESRENWVEITGKSRASWYRIQKLIKERLK